MDPDDYQKAWRAESSQTRVSVDAGLLLKQARRSQQEFRATISWGDYVLIGIFVVLLPEWIYLGVATASPWTWYLMVPVFIWIVGFTLWARARHKRKASEPGEPLITCAKESLALLEHRIWMYGNIVWWYILPMAVSLLAFIAHLSWLKSTGWLDALFDVNACIAVFVIALFYLVYYIDQRVVRTQYEPKRQELLALLASLGDETSSEVSGEYPILMSAKSVTCSPRRTVVAGVCAVALLLCIGIGGILLLSSLENGHPKLAPYTDVRWGGDAPVVEIDGQLHLLFSIDGIPVKDIVAFCQRTYGDKWQKRFAEDLVEVLTGMGHKPSDTVKLDVMPVGQGAARSAKDAAMTAANRRAVTAAVEKRELSEQQLEKLRAKYRDEPAVPLTELVPSLRKEKKLVALAAMVMTDGKIVASAVDGERKTGSGVAATMGDQWHLGSITKSITATMVARLVESGKLQWTDTVGASFPDASIHEDWKPVTLRQLLTHTSGAPANFPVGVRRKQPAIGAESTVARREAVLGVMAEKPEHVPGTEYAYSNVGYTIAGAMAEHVTGETWDALVRREVFEPLALASAGFGPPKSVDKKLEQPQGHTTTFGWKVAAGEDADNTFIIGPAGIVHTTLEDLCAYATEHLRGELGEGKLLSAETYKLLHTPVLDDYAFGWVKKEPSAKLPYTVYWHNGSNTMWYALVVFIPETKTVVAVASNDGDIEKAEAAAWRIVERGG